MTHHASTLLLPLPSLSTFTNTVPTVLRLRAPRRVVRASKYTRSRCLVSCIAFLERLALCGWRSTLARRISSDWGRALENAQRRLYGCCGRPWRRVRVCEDDIWHRGCGVAEKKKSVRSDTASIEYGAYAFSHIRWLVRGSGGTSSSASSALSSSSQSSTTRGSAERERGSGGARCAEVYFCAIRHNFSWKV